VIQGEQDAYGTLEQVRAVERGVAGPVQVRILSNCGHSPQRDQPEATIAAIAGFVARV
jgi:pimeloyl-ACP methyl ester carboxylesterase